MKPTKSHYQTIFQVAPDGMSISRLEDGLFIDANNSFSEMFGYNYEEVVGRTSYELNFWHNFVDRTQIVEKLAEREAIDNFETCIITREGRRVNVMLSARVMELGSEQCLLLTFKNVSSHIQTLNSLRESEKKFKDIFDTTPDSIIVSDNNGHIYDVNSIFETLSGYDRKEIIGKLSTVDIGLWVDTGQRDEFLTKMNQDGKVQNFEMTARARDGQLKIFLVSAMQIVIKGESRILSLARDITLLKSAEQDLREEERRYRELSLEQQTILEAIPDALMIWSDKAEVNGTLVFFMIYPTKLPASFADDLIMTCS
jgi:PAS domain S-box-containing protein